MADRQHMGRGAAWHSQATDLTYEIKLALAEHSRGDITRTQLQDRLRDAIKTAVPL